MSGFHQKNKLFLLLIASGLLVLPACRKDKKAKAKHHHHYEKPAQVKKIADDFDVPLEQDALAFDSQELTDLFDDSVDTAAHNDAIEPQGTAAKTDNSYEWAEEAPIEHSFKTVYFDFDKYNVRNDQKESVSYDAVQLKQLLAEARETGKEPKIMIEGHADSAAGTKEYNFGISHNRAHEVAKLLEKEGVPAANIKVVGRGQDMPAMIDGKKVTGSKNEQWPNRRVEVHIINS
ncbi:OmpA family protein [bacterium]|nr:MAG: OmpA family protein [bacterium]QQR62206.1 MAG: OmpA family protein [bacterium]QQR63235.1 MAG: OmpA family protein [bacterium]